MTETEREGMAVLALRQTQVETEVAHLRQAIMDGFARMDNRLDRLSFVESKLYASEQAAQDLRIMTMAEANKAAIATVKEELVSRINGVSRVSWGSFTLTIGVGLSAIFALVAVLR